jgi:hypothetical protein
VLRLLRLLLALAIRFIRSRSDLLLEILAIRQLLNVMKRRHPQPQLADTDRLFWLMLPGLWPGWKNA